MKVSHRPIRTLNVVGCGYVGEILAQLWSRNDAFTIQHDLKPAQVSAESTVHFIGAGTPCRLEGDAGVLADAIRVFTSVCGRYFEVARKYKRLHHALSVDASKFLPVLQTIAVDLWKHSGVLSRTWSESLATLDELLRGYILKLQLAVALTGSTALRDKAVISAKTPFIELSDRLVGEAYRSLSALGERLAKNCDIRRSCVASI